MAANIFLPGAVKSAAITLTLETALVGLAMTADLFLSADGGNTKAATGGVKNFTAAATQTFNYSITMPTAGNDYKAYFDINYQGTMIMGFVDINDIVVPSGSVTPIVWT